MSNFKTKIKYLKEVEISNQVLIKNDWKLLKKLKDSKNHYYGLIECIHCGYQRLVNYYNFIYSNSIRFHCRQCHKRFINDIVGKTFGSVYVISYNKSAGQDKAGHNLLYFNTKCTKCGHESVRLYNIVQWMQTNGCKDCNKIFEESSYNYIWNSYKTAALDRNYEWSLTPIEFKQLITQNCYYCNEPPRLRAHDSTSLNKKLPVNGIDRVDSSKGYFISNCVPCCSVCNYMKQAYSQDDFLNQITKIYNYRINKGSTTIENTEQSGSELSTSQANGDGNGRHPAKDEDIV